MYSMKETCEKTGLSYETLKFYCNQGLVPNVKRDKHNYRVFDDGDIAWLNSLNDLKDCDMSIAEMREYIKLCCLGESSIPERSQLLEKKAVELSKKMYKINRSLEFIKRRQKFYEGVQSGKIKYYSNF